MLQRVIRSDSDQKKPSEKKCPFFFVGTVQFFLGSIVYIVGGTGLLDDTLWKLSTSLNVLY